MEGAIILQSSSSRWLAGLVAAITLLVVASVIVTLLDRRGGPESLPEGTAQGSVQRYLLAIENGDDREAYGFLSADLLEACDFQHFRDSLRGVQPGSGSRDQDLRITLLDAEAVDDAVEVNVRITRFRLDPPFGGNEYSHLERFDLEEIDDAWRFTSPPWPMRRCPDLVPAPGVPAPRIPPEEVR